MHRGFAFLLNLYDYRGKLPFELLPDFHFDVANANQKETIQLFLAKYQAAFVAGADMYFIKPVKAPPKGSWTYQALSPEEVKFWVINYPYHASRQFLRLDTALSLTRAETDVGATFNADSNPTGIGIIPPTIFHFSQQYLNPIERDLGESDLASASTIYGKIEMFETMKDSESHAAVLRALGQFKSLVSGTRVGGQFILGLFALLESLVTHDPHQFGDSLNHQLSTKMPLLSNRFTLRLAPDTFFDISDPKTTWKRLYEVRSRLAHGAPVDFSKGKLHELRGFEEVRDFMREALRALLTFALDEPQLIRDLQAC